MTSRPNRFAFIFRSILFILAILCFPAAGRGEDVVSSTSGTPSAGGTAAAAVQTGEITTPAAAPGRGEEQYIVKQGDTLWDIANAHYRDPFLWPLIWKANPVIANPDLIYPGATLQLPSLAPIERAISTPQEAPPVQEKAAAPQPIPQKTVEQETPSFFKKQTVESSLPEPPPATPRSKLIGMEATEQPVIDKYAMISAGFISTEPSKDTVIGAVGEPEKSIMGQDDEIYISITSRSDVKIGDRFLIYQPMHEVEHPITDRSYGDLNKVIGVVTVDKTFEGKNTYQARFLISFDTAEKGNLLMPYQEPTLIYPAKQKKTKNLEGYILEVTDEKTLNGQLQFVYLDKGQVDGVEPGDCFTVYVDGGNGSHVPRPIGEVQVFLVKERTATAVIQKNVAVIGPGDRIEYKN